MARRFRGKTGELIPLKKAAFILLLTAVPFAAQPAGVAAPIPSPSPSTPAPSPGPPHPASSPTHPPVAGNPGPKPTPPRKPDGQVEVQRLFEQLSQDQQKKFLDNMLQWKAMSPEEQELMRDRDLIRREKIAMEIQAAIGKLKLNLDDDQREVFALRYTQERRKIEEAIRKETDDERTKMLADMLARLKTEFAADSGPSPAKPAPTASPGH
jgi:hypothetical protein